MLIFIHMIFEFWQWTPAFIGFALLHSHLKTIPTNDKICKTKVANFWTDLFSSLNEPFFYYIDSNKLTILSFFAQRSITQVSFIQESFFFDVILKRHQELFLSTCFYQSVIIIWATIYQFHSIAFVYQAYTLRDCSFNTSKATKHHQWLIYKLVIIQHIPCKQTLVCHVAVESNLYFSYIIVLLYWIDAVMTRVIYRPFILIKYFDCHGP